MKVEITVSKSELLTKLKAVARVINPSNKIIPAHENFMFEVTGDELKVTGADEAGNITTKIDCTIVNVNEPFSFLADAKTLLDGLKELSEQPLKMTIEKAKDSYSVTVIYNNGKYNIHGSKTDGFSIVGNTGIERIILVNIECSDFVEGIKTVHKFAGNDEIRPIMTSVFVESKDGHLRFVSTNSATLAVFESTRQNLPDFNVILPVKLAKILSDILEHEDIVGLDINNRNVTATFGETGEVKIVYRICEGIYPNYRSVIPKDNDKNLQVNTHDIISSIKRTSIFTNKSTSLIILSAENNQVTLNGVDIDFLQSAVESLPAVYQSPEIEIGFGFNLLLKCLDTIESDEVSFSFSEPTRACLITPVSEDETTSLTILIMPLQINV